MVSQHCGHKLRDIAKFVYQPRSFVITICVLNLLASLVGILGNLLVIRALWKTPSIPSTLKKLFYSLAVSDLAVGLIVQPMMVGIIAVMLNTKDSGFHEFEFLCPIVLTAFLFILLAFSATSFLSITAIAFDRLLAVFLHLRYQELVTPRRVFIAVLCMWATSGVGASIFISLPSHNDTVALFLEVIGLLVTSAAYFQIYRVVRHHQCQQTSADVARVKKSAFKTLYMYFLFLGCHFPFLCTMILKAVFDSVPISLQISHFLTALVVLINSALNPFVYCWRYREIREIIKTTVLKIFNKA